MSRPIHIMHIQESLEVGGLENGVVNVVNNLEEESFRSTICCLKRIGSLADRICNPQVSCFCLKQKEGKRIFLPLILRKIIREQRVDIVHTHNFYGGLYGIIAAKIAGGNIKIVHGEHGSLQRENRRRIFLSMIIYSLSDKVVAMSRHQETFLNAIGISSKKTLTIQNGVDLKKFNIWPISIIQKKKRELNLVNAKTVIGCIGRLSQEKGHQYLIDAMNTVCSIIPETHLVLVGDGPLSKRLKEHVSALNLTLNIHFLGNRKDVNEIYPIFDIFALPSLSEGLSNVILEAMACHIPIIATDIRGNREILVHNETAILVPPALPSSLSEAILMLLEDPEKKDKLARAGREFVEKHFSLLRMVDNYAEMYRQLVSSTRK